MEIYFEDSSEILSKVSSIAMKLIKADNSSEDVSLELEPAGGAMRFRLKDSYPVSPGLWFARISLAHNSVDYLIKERVLVNP